MLTVAVVLDVVLFKAMKLGTLPVPLAASPMLVLLFVQLKVAPEGKLLSTCAAIISFAHAVMFTTGLTVGKGFTVTVIV